MVRFATRSGFVSYDGKVVVPAYWDNIYEMLFLEVERWNHFTIFANPAISEVRSANKFANFPVPNTRKHTLEHTVNLPFDLDFALYKLG